MLKEIPELLKAGIISPETAERMQQYYRNKSGQAHSRLFIVFGIFGAILIGLGIILIIAHNWDEFTRPVKTMFSFLPLVVGQAFCVYAFLNKNESVAWRESASVFLFFAVGSCISLISQVYHIPGDISSFILTWMLLCLPVVYLMQSAVTSLLYIAGITYWAANTGYWSFPASEPYFYWLMLAAILQFYFLLYKKNPKSNFIYFHHWFITLSITIALGTIAKGQEEWMYIAYVSLFGLFYLMSRSNFFEKNRQAVNAYSIIGSAGTIIVLLILSFTWFWEDLRRANLTINSPEFFAALIITLIAAILFFLKRKNRSIINFNPVEGVFLLFICIFIVGFFSPVAVILINMLIFFIGILTIRQGAKQDHLGILNYGLLIISTLVVCRFFDTDLSFVVRGLLFVGVGLGFFFANSRMLKKRQENVQ